MDWCNIFEILDQHVFQHLTFDERKTVRLVCTNMKVIVKKLESLKKPSWFKLYYPQDAFGLDHLILREKMIEKCEVLETIEPNSLKIKLSSRQHMSYEDGIFNYEVETVVGKIIPNVINLVAKVELCEKNENFLQSIIEESSLLTLNLNIQNLNNQSKVQEKVLQKIMNTIKNKQEIMRLTITQMPLKQEHKMCKIPQVKELTIVKKFGNRSEIENVNGWKLIQQFTNVTVLTLSINSYIENEEIVKMFHDISETMLRLRKLAIKSDRRWFGDHIIPPVRIKTLENLSIDVMMWSTHKFLLVNTQLLSLRKTQSFLEFEEERNDWEACKMAQKIIIQVTFSIVGENHKIENHMCFNIKEAEIIITKNVGVQVNNVPSVCNKYCTGDLTKYSMEFLKLEQTMKIELFVQIREYDPNWFTCHKPHAKTDGYWEPQILKGCMPSSSSRRRFKAYGDDCRVCRDLYLNNSSDSDDEKEEEDEWDKPDFLCKRQHRYEQF